MQIRGMSERARRALDFADRLAQRDGPSAVSPTHIALGVLREHEGVAVAALWYCEVAPASLEAELAETVAVERANGGAVQSDTLDGDKLLERAHAEALDLGHSYVGTEHLLLALLH